MLFEIFKTSDPEAKPIESATRSQRVEVDERTVDDPAKLPYPGAVDDWYGYGTNHRVEEGHIKRDVGMYDMWQVEVPTIEALVGIVRTSKNPVMVGEDYIEVLDGGGY